MVGSSQANLFASDLGRHQRAVGPAPRRRQPGGDRDARARSRPRAATSQKFVDRAKDKKRQQPPDGLRPPRLQELRPARDDPQEGLRRRARRGSACTSQLLEIAHAARGDRAQGRLLRQPQALPERRLLLGHHLQGARHPDEHVHGDVRARPPAGLDRAVARDAAATRTPGSAGRARSTPARRSARYVPIDKRRR